MCFLSEAAKNPAARKDHAFGIAAYKNGCFAGN
jgi:hypothetical protein